MTYATECGNWDKMKTCQVAMADLTGLPSYHRQTIPEDYMDRMGHMNVSYYMAVFDAATWRMFADHGLDDAYFSRTENGVFALIQFIQYLAEVRPGETVAVYTRLLGLMDKRIHLMHFMANQDAGGLAAIIEPQQRAHSPSLAAGLASEPKKWTEFLTVEDSSQLAARFFNR